jgi:hypothetical protein
VIGWPTVRRVRQSGNLPGVGTVYAAIGFDVEALRSVVVPLVLQTVRAGYERPGGMAPLHGEPHWVENRPHLREPPVEVLSQYFSDFALSVFGNCQRLNQDLAGVSWLAGSRLVSVLVSGGVEGGLVYDLSPWCPLM